MKINGKEYRTIWFDNNAVKIIDQTKLPHQFTIKDLKTVKDIVNAIKTMEVRGAPLIGGAAAYGIVLAILENSDLNFIKEFEKDGDGLSLEETNFILKAKSFTNYELIDGDIRNTLLDFLKKNTTEKFSLIHLDMDVYEPTAFVLGKLFDRLVNGGLFVIDDYNTVEGATIAVDEFIAQHPNLKIERLPYNNIPSFIRKC